MSPAVFSLFDRAMPVILAWLAGFIVLTLVTLLRRGLAGRTDQHRESLIGGELPGILLVLMHSVCFVYAVVLGEWLTALLFAWWGPGFILVATLVLARRPVAWRRWAWFTSVACKINYVLLVGCFLHYGFVAPVFGYSLWIMHDQVRLAWLQQNADRTRRLTEDWWVVRWRYPMFLLLPFVAELPWRVPMMVFAAMILGLWVWGLLRLARARGFFRQPENPTANLRDIVYLKVRDA